jgi:acetylornithine deacetylase/succinyl-diaminopimelate desuccinylase-like protein
MKVEEWISKISAERMSDNLWQLVNIPSPTRNEKDAALYFAQMLKNAGASVEIDSTIPNSPSVIGRLKGNRKGPTLQLTGHIDHVDVPHAKPKREGNIISGRGSADMKNGLTGILEIVQILKDTGCDFPGEILVTVYGLHEAPTGDGAGLNNLIAKGIKGDAAIVFEGLDNAAAIAANGMAIWNLKISIKEPACHEFSVEPNRPDLLGLAFSTANELRKKDNELKAAKNPFPLLARESLFIGQMHYGDFYNRVPNFVYMQGTRRWHPDKTFEQIKEDFDSILSPVSRSRSNEAISIETNWIFVGHSYQIDANEKIVKCLVDAHKAVRNTNCPIRGHSSVTDVSRIVRQGNIPAILCGFGTDTGHCDHEFVEISHIKKCCEVAMYTVFNFLKQP